MKRLIQHKFQFLCCLSLLLLLSACGAPKDESVPVTATVSTPVPATTAPTVMEPEATPVPEILTITEVMTANHASLAASDGSFPDWFEIRNDGPAAVELEQCSISNGKKSASLFGTLEPGEYRVFFCSKDSSSPEILPLSLSSDGCELSLLSSSGAVACSRSVPALESDCSFAFSEDTGFLCYYPTPGFPNTDDGYDQWQKSRSISGLVINEVMTYNRVVAAPDGNYYDWIELKNTSSEPISLADWYLSDSGSDRLLYALPGDVSLAPGELYTVYCSQALTGFSLSNHTETLFLTSAEGVTGDYIYLHSIPNGYSFGRGDAGGFYYLSGPTPDGENSGGIRMVAASPVALEADGVYEAVDQVTVTLSAPGTIHYTLDGSTPSENSPVYSEPLVLSSTTVVRAVSLEEGKLTGDILTLSYILNEGHSIPVVSLVVDPDAMFGRGGVYSTPTADLETAATFAYYDGEESVVIDCGVKLHGATSKVAQSKKSMKIKFKTRYDGKLEYDLFGNGVTEFSSVLLRAAQEGSYSTHLRDVLMHDLASQCTDALPTQATKFAALYINGQYWGLYAIRESHSPEHYAAHYDVDADSVTMTHESWASDPNATAINNVIQYNSMTNAAKYAEIADHIDVENIAAWCLMQAYSGNLDIYPPNLRWYYSTEDEVFRYALVDLDLGLFTIGSFTTPLYTGYVYSNNIARLLYNETFKDQFLTYWGQWLSGPLSDENVTATLDRYVLQIEPEITRDAKRWNYSLDVWEQGLNTSLYYHCDASYGHALNTAKSAASYLGLNSAQYSAYFGNVR